ncbi:Late secretory pathway protein [Yarrowia sp. C11]|nr:Late secretory pathway protein [Yarrowia sp. E02]KAG5371408.1 Late secretory pathway protein [Yarrowia sp. C11]
MAKKKLRAGEVRRQAGDASGGAAANGSANGASSSGTTSRSASGDNTGATGAGAPVPPRASNRPRAGQINTSVTTTTSASNSPTTSVPSSPKTPRSPRTSVPSTPKVVQSPKTQQSPRVVSSSRPGSAGSPMSVKTSPKAVKAASTPKKPTTRKVEAVVIDSSDSEDEFHDTEPVVIDSDDNEDYEAVIETVSQPVLSKAKVVQKKEPEVATSTQTAQKAVSGIPQIKIYSPHNTQSEFKPSEDEDDDDEEITMGDNKIEFGQELTKEMGKKTGSPADAVDAPTGSPIPPPVAVVPPPPVTVTPPPATSPVVVDLDDDDGEVRYKDRFKKKNAKKEKEAKIATPTTPKKIDAEVIDLDDEPAQSPPVTPGAFPTPGTFSSSAPETKKGVNKEVREPAKKKKVEAKEPAKEKTEPSITELKKDTVPETTEISTSVTAGVTSAVSEMTSDPASQEAPEAPEVQETQETVPTPTKSDEATTTTATDSASGSPVTSPNGSPRKGILKQTKHTKKPSIRATHTTITDPMPDDSLLFSVCIVGFHHSLGPQIEEWFGPEDYSHLWPNLPFQALSDGSHSREEDFSYFTLLFDENNKSAPEAGGYSDGRPFNTQTVTTLFGIACNRQVGVTDALKQDSAVTRSTVQKCVVVICRKPIWGPMKDKLAVVTRAFFMQPTFDDKSIIRSLFDSLAHTLTLTKFNSDTSSDVSIGMSLCELVSRLKQKLVVVFKALLLEKRVLFYASSTELLCTSQFSLVSLIPNLINNLQDCGSPLLHSYELGLTRATSLKTSDRQSLLNFMGLPLMVFGEGGMFSPYIPLQQLGDLAQARYYLVGSTNSLLLQQKKQHADVLVNMDDNTVEILNSSLKSPLALSSYDKKWIDRVVQAVDTSSGNSAATTFHGNEDYVRLQFEDYLMGLLSAVKYDNFLSSHGSAPPPEMLLKEVHGNPVKQFSLDWVNCWRATLNYELFNNFTDGELFDIVEPRHMADAVVTEKQKSPFSEVGKAWAGFFSKNGSNTALDKTAGSSSGDKEKSVSPTTSAVSPSVATTVAAGHGATANDTGSQPSDTSVKTHRSSDSTWSINQKSTSWFSRFSTASKDEPEASEPLSPPPAVAERPKAHSESSASGWGKWAASKKISLFGDSSGDADKDKAEKQSEDKKGDEKEEVTEEITDTKSEGAETVKAEEPEEIQMHFEDSPIKKKETISASASPAKSVKERAAMFQ